METILEAKKITVVVVFMISKEVDNLQDQCYFPHLVSISDAGLHLYLEGKSHMEMKIAYRNGKKFVATCRGKQMIIDQPAENNGGDEGMTPPEVFIASIGSCMGIYVLNYCRNININPTDMILSMEWDKAKDPARISKIKVDIKLPKREIKDRSESILKVANHCLIHQTLINPPELEINLTE